MKNNVDRDRNESLKSGNMQMLLVIELRKERILLNRLYVTNLAVCRYHRKVSAVASSFTEEEYRTWVGIIVLPESIRLLALAAKHPNAV